LIDIFGGAFSLEFLVDCRT